MNDTHWSAIIRYFEKLTPAGLSELPDFYDETAFFKDPFNEVTGIADIRKIFAHMFETLVEPKFFITHHIQQDLKAFLVWEFRFKLKNWQRDVEHCIRGGSHLELNESGLIVLHRDYWDAAEELYEKMPVLGILMRALKKRARTP
jgi:steroid Delta-isomerase